MANTKMTKRDYYAQLREIVADNAELVEFIDRQVELLDRKSTSPRKPTKAQQENEAFKADIIETLTTLDKPVTIKELMTECESISELTNQRITSLLTALRKEGQVTRSYVKKVAYFSIGCEDTDEDEGE